MPRPDRQEVTFRGVDLSSPGTTLDIRDMFPDSEARMNCPCPSCEEWRASLVSPEPYEWLTPDALPEPEPEPDAPDPVLGADPDEDEPDPYDAGVPTCDICNHTQWLADEDWNGETGNHRSCEQAEDAGEEPDRARPTREDWCENPACACNPDGVVPERPAPRPRRTHARYCPFDINGTCTCGRNIPMPRFEPNPFVLTRLDINGNPLPDRPRNATQQRMSNVTPLERALDNLIATTSHTPPGEGRMLHSATCPACMLSDALRAMRRTRENPHREGTRAHARWDRERAQSDHAMDMRSETYWSS